MFHNTNQTRIGTSSIDTAHTRTDADKTDMSMPGSSMERLESVNRSLPRLLVAPVLGAVAFTSVLLAIFGVSYIIIKAKNSVNEHTPLLQA